MVNSSFAVSLNLVLMSELEDLVANNNQDIIITFDLMLTDLR